MKDVIVPSPKGPAKVLHQVMTYYGSPSTFYAVEVVETGEEAVVHENIIKGVLDGTLTNNPYEKKVRAKKEGPTAKDRAREIVCKCLADGMSRGETIKAIAKKMGVSKGTAQSYYYAVK